MCQIFNPQSSFYRLYRLGTKGPYTFKTRQKTIAAHLELQTYTRGYRHSQSFVHTSQRLHTYSAVPVECSNSRLKSSP
jgi:hypothetical protein